MTINRNETKRTSREHVSPEGKSRGRGTGRPGQNGSSGSLGGSPRRRTAGQHYNNLYKTQKPHGKSAKKILAALL